MRKISLPFIFIFILLLINIWSIIKLTKTNAAARELELLAASRKSELVSLQKDLNTLKQNMSLAFKAGSNKFRTVPGLDSLQRTEKKLLVLRVHQDNCNECVIQSLRALEEAKVSLPVVLLANFPAVDGVVNNFGKTAYPIVLARRVSLDLPGVSNPYFFILNGNGTVSDIFFPDWKLMDVFSKYIEAVTLTN